MVNQLVVHDVPATTPEEWRQQQEVLLAESDRLYDLHVRPLERDHWGAFVAVAPDGRLLMRSSLDSLTEDATAVFGQGHFAFKVGDVAVEHVR